MITRWFSRMVRAAFNDQMAGEQMRGYKRGREAGYDEGRNAGFDEAIIHQIRHVGVIERGAKDKFAAQIRGPG